MKIKDGMILRQVAGKYVAVPTGKAAENFNGLIRLNETGHDVWVGIENGLTVDEIAKKFTEDYEDVTFEYAKECVEKLVESLKKEGFVTE